MGTPEFAVASLKALLEAGFNIVGVVTAPDKPAGRGQKIQESDVKKFAKERNLHILQPEKLKDSVFIEELRSLRADLQVVVAFRMLPEIIWSMPKYGTINLHASLLPHYRGAAPINWAIINGETETGVTTFIINKEIDTGRTILNAKVAIAANDNAGTLHDKLMETGAQLLVKTVESICVGNYKATEQHSLLKPGETIKLAPKIFKEDCKISWDKSIDEVYNFIRGLSPYPAAWSEFKHTSNGEILSFKVFDVQKEISKHSYSEGELVTDSKKFLKIAVKGGFVSLQTLQLEGKKRLNIEEFLRGFRITDYKINN
jgi:methionyl-tRNA formyltransferase